jgi:hypothetical protein
LNVLGFSQLDYRERTDAPVMANLGRFNQMLTDYETAYRIGGRTMKWENDLKNLCWFFNGTFCQGEQRAGWEDKLQICRQCEVSEAAMPAVANANTTPPPA